MEIYKNPNCKKVRGSHILEVTCAYCKCFIANYQKVGEIEMELLRWCLYVEMPESTELTPRPLIRSCWRLRKQIFPNTKTAAVVSTKETAAAKVLLAYITSNGFFFADLSDSL